MSLFEINVHKLKIKELKALKSKDPNNPIYDEIIAEEEECIRLCRAGY